MKVNLIFTQILLQFQFALWTRFCFYCPTDKRRYQRVAHMHMLNCMYIHTYIKYILRLLLAFASYSRLISIKLTFECETWQDPNPKTRDPRPQVSIVLYNYFYTLLLSFNSTMVSTISIIWKCQDRFFIHTLANSNSWPLSVRWVQLQPWFGFVANITDLLLECSLLNYKIGLSLTVFMCCKSPTNTYKDVTDINICMYIDLWLISCIYF